MLPFNTLSSIKKDYKYKKPDSGPMLMCLFHVHPCYKCVLNNNWFSYFKIARKY